MKTGVIREANGRSSRSDRVIHIQRLLEGVKATGLGHEFGTSLGYLLLTERITTPHYEAGTWFSQARRAADGALGLPARNVPAQDMNALHGSSTSIEDDEAIRRKRTAIEKYDRAENALGLNSSRLRAVLWVCVYDRRPDTHEQFLALVDGLNALVRHRSERRAA